MVLQLRDEEGLEVALGEKKPAFINKGDREAHKGREGKNGARLAKRRSSIALEGVEEKDWGEQVGELPCTLLMCVCDRN